MDRKTANTALLGISEEKSSEFCRDNQIRELALFGSILRADFDAATSDIDILVEFEPDATIGFLALARVQRELGELLGRSVDLVPKSGLKPLIRDDVLSSTTTLYAN